ncbi:hypothetical protein [Aliikangiella sp. G2MR2-5]|uniref:hypothetical protein n=1 Tax=Aliikangiella sp. G2MR2-5 TaxID=2788943 RepID=UPI0018A9522D|nr:hypothetical protein [Aliikangiella sp. G2MR2-5]
MGLARDRLDELVRKEWHKNFRRYSIYVAISALLIMITVASSTGVSRVIQVPVKHLYSEATENEERFYILIDVNSLTTKRIRVPRATVVKIGDKVSVVEKTTNFFGMKKYTFQKVLR